MVSFGAAGVAPKELQNSKANEPDLPPGDPAAVPHQLNQDQKGNQNTAYWSGKKNVTFIEILQERTMIFVHISLESNSIFFCSILILQHNS